MDAAEEEKILTELGRKQAEATGRRLKELELPFTKMCVSTVVRARETADLGRTRKMTLEIHIHSVFWEETNEELACLLAIFIRKNV